MDQVGKVKDVIQKVEEKKNADSVKKPETVSTDKKPDFDAGKVQEKKISGSPKNDLMGNPIEVPKKT